MMSFYRERNIQYIKVIVDQVNNLYNRSLKERKPHLANWTAIAPFARPMFMVSSKNNPFLTAKNDPILSITKNKKDQHYLKVNIDN